MDDVEKRLCRLSNKYNIISDEINVTDNIIRVKVIGKKDLPIIMNMNR